MFENYAGDDKLTPDHWFWDKEQSGGIFIEHAVHFFDLYNGWFGDGRVEAAQAGTRPGAPQIEEQVHALVRHPDDVLSSFYHGFHQPGRLDRQEFRIVCERGDIRLFEWVPTAIKIDFIATAADAEAVTSLVPNGKQETVLGYAGEERRGVGLHKLFAADGHFRVAGDNGMAKQEIYGYMVRQLLDDQIAAIQNPEHRRLVSEHNGYQSLLMAADAAELAAGTD